eukprot:5699638-Karenia_brevis.AAC.1
MWPGAGLAFAPFQQRLSSQNHRFDLGPAWQWVGNATTLAWHRDGSGMAPGVRASFLNEQGDHPAGDKEIGGRYGWGQRRWTHWHRGLGHVD